MAKIAITGAAGFIAFHLAQKIHSAGHVVCGFDNFNNYYDPGLKLSRAEILKKDFNINVDRIDLNQPRGLDIWFETNKPDIVMHLAAMAGVRHSMDDPGAYVENNIVGTHNLIQACTKAGVNKVVY